MNMYDIDAHIAEIYDQSETYSDDIDLLRRLMAAQGAAPQGWRILEPFCGTGRMLLPLALDGHHLTGLDQAHGMLERLRLKLSALPEAVHRRVSLIETDLLQTQWPAGFDLVILGCNCLYEFGCPEDQQAVIQAAAGALQPGGFIFVDNDHMEGELDRSWLTPGVSPAFPIGTCADGTRVDSTWQVVWSDIPARQVRYRRATRLRYPDGQVVEREYLRQTHPVSQAEVQGWLEAAGFNILSIFGDRQGNPYTPRSERAIFWAQKS